MLTEDEAPDAKGVEFRPSGSEVCKRNIEVFQMGGNGIVSHGCEVDEGRVESRGGSRSLPHHPRVGGCLFTRRLTRSTTEDHVCYMEVRSHYGPAWSSTYPSGLPIRSRSSEARPQHTRSNDSSESEVQGTSFDPSHRLRGNLWGLGKKDGYPPHDLRCGLYKCQQTPIQCGDSLPYPALTSLCLAYFPRPKIMSMSSSLVPVLRA